MPCWEFKINNGVSIYTSYHKVIWADLSTILLKISLYFCFLKLQMKFDLINLWRSYQGKYARTSSLHNSKLMWNVSSHQCNEILRISYIIIDYFQRDLHAWTPEWSHCQKIRRNSESFIATRLLNSTNHHFNENFLNYLPPLSIIFNSSYKFGFRNGRANKCFAGVFTSSIILSFKEINKKHYVILCFTASSSVRSHGNK